MENLENICKWKTLIEKHTQKEYYVLRGPFFICKYCCDGLNKSCGGYLKNEQKNRN